MDYSDFGDSISHSGCRGGRLFYGWVIVCEAAADESVTTLSPCEAARLRRLSHAAMACFFCTEVAMLSIRPSRACLPSIPEDVRPSVIATVYSGLPGFAPARAMPSILAAQGGL